MHALDLLLAQHLPSDLYQQLQAYQQQSGHLSLVAALQAILVDYFDPAPIVPTEAAPEALSQRLSELENQVKTLTRELIVLRQDTPQGYDRLREQLAAVRLSHSGLLQNLQQRLEILEQQMDLESLENQDEN